MSSDTIKLVGETDAECAANLPDFWKKFVVNYIYESLELYDPGCSCQRRAPCLRCERQFDVHGNNIYQKHKDGNLFFYTGRGITTRVRYDKGIYRITGAWPAEGKVSGATPDHIIADDLSDTDPTPADLLKPWWQTDIIEKHWARKKAKIERHGRAWGMAEVKLDKTVKRAKTSYLDEVQARANEIADNARRLVIDPDFNNEKAGFTPILSPTERAAINREAGAIVKSLARRRSNVRAMERIEGLSSDYRTNLLRNDE